MLDLRIRNAQVLDGTGTPARAEEVGVEGDRITRIGDLTGVAARRTLDADGAVLAPGFIDLHTHSDFTLPCYPRAQSMVRQGVTTQLVGNCGLSPFPLSSGSRGLLRRSCAYLDGGLSWDWERTSEYAAMLESRPLATNVALQVGHGAVRAAVLGFEDRPPSAGELDAMRRLVADAFEEGVVGLSSGLIYPPGSYADTDELVALAEVARRYGGFYSTHIRDEAGGLLEAVDEALHIGRRAGVGVQLSHHKAGGRANWGAVTESLRHIDRARADGMDVSADQYPYTASSTTLSSILPGWTLAGGVDAMRARLADPSLRSRLRAEVTSDLDTIGLASLTEHRQYEGRRLSAVARERGTSGIDTALELLAAEPDGVGIVNFGMSEEDVRQVMRHPAVAVASDGWVLDPSAGGTPHPRSYGTFVRVLGRYVRDEGVLSLPEAVRKMTSLPAQRLGRDDLGRIAPGAWADLVVFDPASVAERATFADPHRFGDGVPAVVVGGRMVIDDGSDTGTAAGRLLR
jgi:N-acyl-D-amino-acid deacylase